MTQKDRELHFKPLSEGLGFHPFSNGYPYTPAQTPPAPKRDFSQGTGAVSEGFPQFAFPAPKQVVVVAKPTLPAPAMHPSQLGAQLGSQLGWDYLVRRFTAYSVDCLFNTTLALVTLGASLWKENIWEGVLLNMDLFLATLAFLGFFSWALTAAEEIAFGTSLGKRLLGLKLEGSGGALLLRALIFVPSLLCLGIGVLWTVLDPDRRALHDVLSGVQPEDA